MRILMINNFAHVTGGADLHCLEITQELRRRGHDVAWLSTASPRNVETSGVFVRPTVTAESREGLPWKSRLDVARRALWNPDAAMATATLSTSFAPDVAHVHKSYVQLSVAPIVVANRSGIPLVQTVHDYEFLSASPLDPEGGRWDRDESKLSYRALNSATGLVRRRVHRSRISRWIAVSRTVARYYRSVGGIESTVIPNFSREPTPSPVPFEERDGLLFIGRLTSEKGISDLLKSVMSLPECRFVVAGDGPMRADVIRAAEDFPNLTYRGFVDQVEAQQLIRTSTACLMPSLWQEPGPLACLESMAEGTPVICYPNGGLAEYVRDSEAGVVCEQADHSDLTAAIRSLTSDRENWVTSSAKALEGIRDHHSKAGYIDALERVYWSAVRATSDGSQLG